MNDERLSILKYADDIVLLAESAEDLQSMLNELSKWTKRWRLLVYIDKTKVMHCWKPSKAVTDFRSGIQFNLLLSPYPCFISLLYLDLYVLGDDALIS